MLYLSHKITSADNLMDDDVFQQNAKLLLNENKKCYLIPCPEVNIFWENI